MSNFDYAGHTALSEPGFANPVVLRGSKPSKTLCTGDAKCFICIRRAIDSHTRPEDGPRVTDRTYKVRLG